VGESGLFMDNQRFPGALVEPSMGPSLVEMIEFGRSRGFSGVVAVATIQGLISSGNYLEVQELVQELVQTVDQRFAHISINSRCWVRLVFQ
jgi:hypothetical protein